MKCLKIESPSRFEDSLLDRVSQIEKECMNYGWNYSMWKDFSRSYGENSKLYIATQASHSIGLLLFQLNPWETQAHLLKIGLKPETRGSGAATVLLERGKNWLKSNEYKEIYLEVATSNQRAVGFYRKSGFVELCVKKQFYSDGADALAMLLSL